jgi:phage-related protein
MASTAELKQQLESLRGVLFKLQEPVAASSQAVGKIKNVVHKPEASARKLMEIERSLHMMRQLTSFLSAFPVIGMVMNRAGYILDAMRGAISGMTQTMMRIADVLRPVAQAAERLDKPIEKAKASFAKHIGTVSGAIGKVEAIERQWPSGLPGPVEAAIDLANKALKPIVPRIISVQGALEPGLNGVTSGANEINGIFKTVEDAIRVVDDVDSVINTFRSVVSTLYSALEPFKYLIKLIDYISGIINKVLNSILKTFGIDLDSLVRRLESVLNPLNQFLEPLRRAVDEVGRAFSRFANVDGLTRQLDEIIEGFNSVEAAIKPINTPAISRQIVKAAVLAGAKVSDVEIPTLSRTTAPIRKFKPAKRALRKVVLKTTSRTKRKLAARTKATQRKKTARRSLAK